MTEQLVSVPFGFINLAKPSGQSSAQYGYRIRAALHAAAKLSGKPRALALGHFGTLDPAASGVLPLAVGKATRLFPLIANRTKIYTFDLCLGQRTSTGDAESDAMETAAVPVDFLGRIQAALPAFTGALAQIPPMVSAGHHGGRRLYELARDGVTVERRARPITIFSLTIIGSAKSSVELRVHCSEGTYVRTLCEDLAAAIGTVGHMRNLVRESAGPFALAQAQSFETVLADPIGALIDPRAILDLPSIVLDEAEQALFQVGNRVAIGTRLPEGPICFAVDGAGSSSRILGFATANEGYLLPQRVFG